MIKSGLTNMFIDDSIDKQLHIEFEGGSSQNGDIAMESMELTETLCAEDMITFGGCCASCFTVTILNNMVPLQGKQLTVSYTLGTSQEVFYLGKYIVDSDKPTADRRYRDIVAYDAMYTILNRDVAEWYNGLAFPLTLKAFRDSFLAWFKIEQEPVQLVNDNMTVHDTIKPSQLSGKVVINSICELNGCFGHIGRNGKFQYKFLPKMIGGLYPSNTLYPSDSVYPSDSASEPVGIYMNCTYEDFLTPRIDKLQIRQEENDIGAIAGTGDNCYIVEDNFLVYGKNPEELASIAVNLLSVIKDVSPYRPFDAEAKGNPCIEVGDTVRLATQTEIVESYVLSRQLKGIQALRDTYTAEGSATMSEDVNSVHKDIIQLRGKANTLSRTVEETRLEIKDIEKGLSSRITQTAESITAEVSRATSAEGSLSSQISQTAEGITSEVQRATLAEGSLSSRISQTADSISTKVEKGTISSEISQESDKIAIRSNRFVLDSTNCSITADGTITAKNGTFTGKIISTDATIVGGKITLRSDNNDYSLIKLSHNYGSYTCGMDPYGIRITSPYGTTVLGGNGCSYTAPVTFTGGLYTDNIRAVNTYGTVIFNSKVQFTDNATFNTLSAVNMSGSVAISGTLTASSTVKLGSSISQLGFFGGSGSSKKSISTISSTSTASAADCANKINEIITALRAYSLIG